MQVNKKYAAFIMTYKRVDILADTIAQVLQQTIPPSKILIVDNDPDRSAEKVPEKFNDHQIDYYSVGSNSGPAGAAYWGMQILFKEGWEWVLWMDDNDPPHFDDVIEHLFSIPENYPHPEKIGMLGAVGVRFNKDQARVNRVPDADLHGIIEVDNVAGNLLPLIHRSVYDKQIFPTRELFFGFEELDFSLSIIQHGMKVLISGDELYRHRSKAGRLNLKQKIYVQKNGDRLWREFYSMRNLAYILLYKDRSYKGLARLFIRSIGKSMIGFKYGVKYGLKNMKYMILGFWMGVFKKMGYIKWV